MAQENVRLARETNKLILQTLSKEGGIYLPTIGSLTFESVEKGGEQVNTITLSDKVQHQSLVEIIEERGKCSDKQAKLLYDKWLAEIKRSNGYYLVSIGEIVNGRFIVERSLFNRLNPKSLRATSTTTTPPPTPKPSAPSAKRSMMPALWIGVVGLAVAMVVAVVVLRGVDVGDLIAPKEVAEEVVTAEAREVVEIEIETEEVAVEAEQIEVIEPREIVGDPYAAFNAAYAASRNPKPYRVVCGNFRSKRNAGKMILDIESQTTLKGATPRVYVRDNGQYMVTLFEGNSFGECSQYIKGGVLELYSGSWVYSDK
ncbi:MAG: hypothetical protein SNF68_07925 [Rikenellaceae bacterium]